MMNHLAEVPLQFNNSINACYSSVKEVVTVWALYKATLQTNSQIIKFNTLFNSGKVITSISNIIMYYLLPEYSRVTDDFMLGKEIGSILFDIFYPYEVMLNQQLQAGATFAKDYSWFYVQ